MTLGYCIRFIPVFFYFSTGPPSGASARTLKTTIEVAIIIYFYYYCFTGPVRFSVPRLGLVVVMWYRVLSSSCYNGNFSNVQRPTIIMLSFKRLKIFYLFYIKIKYYDKYFKVVFSFLSRTIIRVWVFFNIRTPEPER